MRWRGIKKFFKSISGSSQSAVGWKCRRCGSLQTGTPSKLFCMKCEANQSVHRTNEQTWSRSVGARTVDQDPKPTSSPELTDRRDATSLPDQNRDHLSRDNLHIWASLRSWLQHNNSLDTTTKNLIIEIESNIRSYGDHINADTAKLASDLVNRYRNEGWSPKIKKPKRPSRRPKKRNRPNTHLTARAIRPNPPKQPQITHRILRFIQELEEPELKNLGDIAQITKAKIRRHLQDEYTTYQIDKAIDSMELTGRLVNYAEKEGEYNFRSLEYEERINNS